MAAQDTPYNGWSNYPTWAVNLWLSNDEGLYNMTREAVQDEYEDAPNCIQVRDGVWTVEEARRFNTADRLREMVEELGVTVANQYAGDSATGNLQGFDADLYGWALGQVNWNEIADGWIISHEENLSYSAGVES